MSFPKLLLTFSSWARRDIDDILLYTLRTWGKQQVVLYRRLLNKATQDLRSNPAMGRPRLELGRTLYTLSAGQHVIVYSKEETRVHIIRVLHSRMDLPSHIPPSLTLH